MGRVGTEEAGSRGLQGLESCPSEVGMDLQSLGVIPSSHARDPGDAY